MAKSHVQYDGLSASLRSISLSTQDLLNIEGAGAAIQINGQRLRVPVKTGATKLSIGRHIIKADSSQVIDEIGPETTYAPPIEFGRSDMPNYPAQPFVRPAALSDFETTIRAIGTTFGRLVVSRWV